MGNGGHTDVVPSAAESSRGVAEVGGVGTASSSVASSMSSAVTLEAMSSSYS